MKVFSLASMLMIVAAATPAIAGVNVDINVGAPVVVRPAVPPPPVPVYAAPPEIVVSEAPQFIFSPALGFYVAVGVPYDLVYTGSEYLYFNGGRWYRGPNYYGPWVGSGPRDFPVLRRYNIRQIHHYRDYEFRRYHADRAHYNGRFYRPEFHGGRHGGHPGEHRGGHDRR